MRNKKGADLSRRPRNVQKLQALNLMVTATAPGPVTGSPLEPEKSRAARAGLLHGTMFNPNKVQKWTTADGKCRPGTPDPIAG
jgi:hypothetical protein